MLQCLALPFLNNFDPFWHPSVVVYASFPEENNFLIFTDSALKVSYTIGSFRSSGPIRKLQKFTSSVYADLTHVFLCMCYFVKGLRLFWSSSVTEVLDFMCILHDLYRNTAKVNFPMLDEIHA